MCFNMEMSYAVATSAAVTATVLARQGESRRAYLPLVFFASMEALQGTQYFVVNQCDDLLNKVLVYVAWAHVSLQPYVFNIWISNFVGDGRMRDNFLRIVPPMCLIAALFLFGKAYLGPFPSCQVGVEYFCGVKACAYQGNWHIAWELPLRAGGFFYITPSLFMHFFLMFVPAVVVGQRVIALVIMLTGPILALLITDDINEQPVIWCFFSSFQLILTYRWHRRRTRSRAHRETTEVPQEADVSRQTR